MCVDLGGGGGGEVQQKNEGKVIGNVTNKEKSALGGN